jgi:hypothetical protein
MKKEDREYINSLIKMMELDMSVARRKLLIREFVCNIPEEVFENENILNLLPKYGIKVDEMGYKDIIKEVCKEVNDIVENAVRNKEDEVITELAENPEFIDAAITYHALSSDESTKEDLIKNESFEKLMSLGVDIPMAKDLSNIDIDDIKEERKGNGNLLDLIEIELQPDIKFSETIDDIKFIM